MPPDAQTVGWLMVDTRYCNDTRTRGAPHSNAIYPRGVCVRVSQLSRTACHVVVPVHDTTVNPNSWFSIPVVMKLPVFRKSTTMG